MAEVEEQEEGGIRYAGGAGADVWVGDSSSLSLSPSSRKSCLRQQAQVSLMMVLCLAEHRRNHHQKNKTKGGTVERRRKKGKGEKKSGEKKTYLLNKPFTSPIS